LHVLGVWLRDGRCKHYFISKCNLLDQCDKETARKLLSVKKEWLANWFVDNCIRKCAEGCNDSVSRLFHDLDSGTKLRCAVSAVIDYRKNSLHRHVAVMFFLGLDTICNTVSNESLTMRSSICWLQDLAKTDQSLCVFFTSVAFLHVARKTTQNLLTRQLLVSLVVICRQLVNTMSSTTDEVLKQFCHLLKLFVAKVPILNFLFCEDTARNSQLLNVFEEKTEQGYRLDTAELVELLQQYAVECMTIFCQMRHSFSVLEMVPADLKALYAYKRGDYERCFQLSRFLFLSHVALYDRQQRTWFMPMFAYTEFIQLMDDDIVSLIALTLIADPSCRYCNTQRDAIIAQHVLLTHLQIGCLNKLGRPVAYHNAIPASFEFLQKESTVRYSTADGLMLKLLEHKLRKLQ